MSENRSSLYSLLHPGVPRRWLFAFAGSLWITAGLVLLIRAVEWMLSFPLTLDLGIEGSSIALSCLVYYFGFSRIVRKNIRRISSLPEYPCAFAFTAWYGYLMVASMITLGITLRNSSIPRLYLSVPYLTMGSILLLGAIQFLRQFFFPSSDQ